MTDREAKRMLKEEGLTYGDAVMLVSSFVPGGKSKSWPRTSQEEMKQTVFDAIERIRQEKGTSDFRFGFGDVGSNGFIGYCILREFA